MTLSGPTEATVGTVAAALERRPVVACTHDHDLTPPTIVDAAMQAADDRIARARARLLRRDVCVSCGQALTLPTRRTVRPVTVAAAGAPVVTIQLDLPATRCPSCALDQVPSRSREDLVVVIPALFAAGARS